MKECKGYEAEALRDLTVCTNPKRRCRGRCKYSVYDSGATPCSGYSPEHRLLKDVDEQQTWKEQEEMVLKNNRSVAQLTSSLEASMARRLVVNRGLKLTSAYVADAPGGQLSGSVSLAYPPYAVQEKGEKAAHKHRQSSNLTS